jgi:tetratricopeptide (TPR) repeat protein
MTNPTSGTSSLISSRSLIEQYIIIWLDSDVNHATTNTKNSFNNIRHIVHSIKTFINIDECNTFLNTIKKGQIFMIINNSFVQEHLRLINLIEETIQINSVYIFCNDPSQEKHWENECRKLKGIFTQMEPICNALEQIICPPEITSPPPTSIISTIETNFDDLDQSYIYTKLLTEIIYRIDYDDKAKKESFDFCREYFSDNPTISKAIDEFERDYQQQSPIWWYTNEATHIRALLRDALVTQDIDMMIKMGFFIRDLHRQLKKIHEKFYGKEKLIVYRGQGMLNVDFEKFITREGGLYAFHNFISTSTNKDVALHFAQCAAVDDGCTGIVFQMEIDPTICPVPFASLDNISYYDNAENEVLFSTHTVFRIGTMNRIDGGLWQVNLTLTRICDEQMLFLTYHIGKEIQGVTNWHSLATLLYKMGKYNTAIQALNQIIEQTDSDRSEKTLTALASTYNNFGVMYDSMEDYSRALEYFHKALEIQKQYFRGDHPSLAIAYSNIGMTHRALGDYAEALESCEKTLEISKKSSPTNLKLLTTAYSNIGIIYESIGDYLKALSFYQEAFKIQQSFLPLHHPSFTLIYNNFGGIYSLMGKYSEALSSYKDTLKIQEKCLPADHSSMAITYSNIGHVYQLMGNYNRSLVYYKNALTIQNKISSPNQLSLATMHNNIGLVYRLMGNYRKACSCYQKTLKIEEEYLSEDHPSLAGTYNNLGAVHQSMEEYSNALSYYQRALDIWQKCLPPNHSSLATIYNNMGVVYDLMKDYQQALSYYEKTVQIQQNLSFANELDRASTYNNMGEVYRAMGDYTTALSYYQKTLEIERKDLSVNHPSLAITLSNMAVAFDANNQYEEAFEHAARALDICCNALEPNHPQTEATNKYLDQLRAKLPSVS